MVLFATLFNRCRCAGDAEEVQQGVADIWRNLVAERSDRLAQFSVEQRRVRNDLMEVYKTINGTDIGGSQNLFHMMGYAESSQGCLILICTNNATMKFSLAVA